VAVSSAGETVSFRPVGGNLSTSQYGAYASYLQSYVNYMSSNGASLYAISMQNEPDANVTYESRFWTGAQMDTWMSTTRRR
jgi:glucuronoarabinoxylan endo-1,4-beta-xylanase